MTHISIIIPVRRGGKVLALHALKLRNQEHLTQFEILVAEGSAPSRQRNLAAAAATGEVLYFLDDDSMISDQSLCICLRAFEDENVAVAGGPSLTPDDSPPLQQLFGLALQSRFGSGAMRFRYQSSGVTRLTSERELILCNLAIRRSVFQDMGGFDERLYPNEENELLERIVAAGHTVLHNPDMTVTRNQRPTLQAFIRQMFGYGRGRAQQLLLSGKSPVISFVPLFFLVYVAFLPFLPAQNFLSALPLCLYSILDVAFTILALCTSGRFVAMGLTILFPIMHLANGFGLLYGLVRGKPLRRSDESITVRCIKAFDQAEW